MSQVALPWTEMDNKENRQIVNTLGEKDSHYLSRDVFTENTTHTDIGLKCPICSSFLQQVGPANQVSCDCWVCGSEAASGTACTNQECKFALCQTRNPPMVGSCQRILKVGKNIADSNSRSMINALAKQQSGQTGEYSIHQAVNDVIWFSMFFNCNMFEHLCERFIFPGTEFAPKFQDSSFLLLENLSTNYVFFLTHALCISGAKSLRTGIRKILLRLLRFDSKLHTKVDLFMKFKTIQRVIDREDQDLFDMLLTIDKGNPNELAEQALMYIADSGTGLKLLADLLNSGQVDPGCKGNKAIRIASFKGNEGVVQILLADKRVNGSVHEMKPFRVACANGHLEVMKILIDHGCGDLKDFENDAVIWASKGGHHKVVDFLIAAFEIHSLSPLYDPHVLITASEHGHLKIVQSLLQLPNYKPNARSNAAIAQAVRNGRWHIVDILLRDPRTEEHCDGAHKLVCNHGHFTLCIFLISLIISTDTGDCYDDHIMGIIDVLRGLACCTEEELEDSNSCFLELWNISLQLFDVEPECIENCLNLILEVACLEGLYSTSQFLLRYCSQFLENYLEDSFQLSLVHQHYDIANTFLELGCIDLGCHGNYAMTRACSDGEKLMVESLLNDTKVNLSACGFEALECAITYGREDVLNCLLSHPRFPSDVLTNRHFVLACRESNIQVVKLLLENQLCLLPEELDEAAEGAMEQGDFQIIRMLLESTSYVLHQKVLEIACSRNDVDSIRFLLRTLQPNESSFLNACTYGDITTVDILISQSIFDLQSQKKAVRIACESQDPKLLDFLLSVFRETYIDTDGLALSNACAMNCVTSVTSILKVQQPQMTHEVLRDALFAACDTGATEALHVLLRFDAAGFTDAELGQAFKLVCIQGSRDSAETILRETSYSRNLFNVQTALEKAISLGHLEIVHLLSQEPGVELFSGDRGETSLECACIFGKLPVVQFLLSQPGCDPMVHCNSPFELAALHDHHHVVTELLQNDRVDPSINGLAWFLPKTRGRKKAFRPLSLSMERLILRNFCFDNLGKDELHRIFIWAIDQSDLRTLIRLLESRKFDPNENKYQGILRACKYGKLEVVEALLSYKHVLRSQFEEIDDPIVCAARFGKWDIVKVLAHDPLVDVWAGNRSVYFFACKSGSWRTVKLLLKKPGALYALQSKANFHVACMYNRTQIVHLHLDEPRFPHYSVAQGLANACAAGHIDVVDLILDRVDVHSGQFRTALKEAIYYDQPRIVQSMLKYKVMSEGDLNTLAIPLAISLGNLKVAKQCLEDSRSNTESFPAQAFWKCHCDKTRNLIFERVRFTVEYAANNKVHRKILQPLRCESNMVASWCLAKFDVPGDVLLTILRKWL